MIEQILIAVMQIVAMTWTGIATLDIVRKQTLAKNLNWVFSQPAFLRKYHLPEYRLIVFLASITIVTVILSAWVIPQISIVHIKSSAIIVSVIILLAYHGYQESRIANQIPKAELRTASLLKRTIDSYVPNKLRLTADLLAIAIVVAYLITFILGLIPKSFALANGISIVTLVSALALGRYLVISENSPHFKQIQMISDQDLSENYRKLSLTVLLYLQLYLSIIMAAVLIVYCDGYQLFQQPFQESFQNWFAESTKMPVLFSLEDYDLLVSITLTPLLIFLPMSKAFQDIRKIKLINHIQENV